MTELAVKQCETSGPDARRLIAENAIRQQIARCNSQAVKYSGPVLVMSEERLRQNVRGFMAAMPRVRPHFAVKANPDAEILRIFKEEGTYFEIASIAELDAMIELGVDIETVFYSNPIKSPASIKHAAAHGVVWFAVDTPEEIIKIAAIKQDAKLYLRIEVSNEGSAWPLAGKFGATAKGVDALIEMANKQAIQIAGVTFHVGSQCTNINNWVEGIRSAKCLFEKLHDHGFSPELLNLGGGYPLQFTGDEPTIDEIALEINQALLGIPDSIQVMAEPGRYFVGSAGCLISQVVGLATRDDQRWLYLDTGVYGGLMELAEGFPSIMVSQRTGETEIWTVAGPTCDSIDVLGKYSLPRNTEVEDLIFMPNLGAYCTPCASTFNGFPAPRMTMVG